MHNGTTWKTISADRGSDSVFPPFRKPEIYVYKIPDLFASGIAHIASDADQIIREEIFFAQVGTPRPRVATRESPRFILESVAG